MELGAGWHAAVGGRRVVGEGAWRRGESRGAVGAERSGGGGCQCGTGIYGIENVLLTHSQIAMISVVGLAVHFGFILQIETRMLTPLSPLPLTTHPPPPPPLPNIYSLPTTESTKHLAVLNSPSQHSGGDIESAQGAEATE